MDFETLSDPVPEVEGWFDNPWNYLVCTLVPWYILLQYAVTNISKTALLWSAGRLFFAMIASCYILASQGRFLWWLAGKYGRRAPKSMQRKALDLKVAALSGVKRTLSSEPLTPTTPVFKKAKLRAPPVVSSNQTEDQVLEDWYAQGVVRKR